MKLTDISSRLGISVSTVSRALRKAEGVDTQTRTRVLAEAARAGYCGPGRQRLMKTGKTRTILALSRNDAGSISYEVTAGMSRAAIELNVSILTHQTPHDSPESILNPKLQPPAMRTGQLDGIVLLTEWPDAAVSELQKVYPVVSMLYDYPGCDVVGIDEVEGMKTLASHLGSAGSVGYFGFRDGSTIHRRLHAAFRNVDSTKIDLRVIEVPREPHSGIPAAESGANELLRYFDSGMYAWICPDGASADQLKDIAQGLGRGTAESLVIGVFHPSRRPGPDTLHWPTLEIPAEELGIAAVRRLLQRIEHPLESIRRISLKATLSKGIPVSKYQIPEHAHFVP